MTNIRKIVSVLGTTALAAGAAYGVDAGHSDTSTAATQAGSNAQSGWPDRPGPRPDLGALASKLGVSQAELRKALEATRPSGDHRNEMTTELAAALGVKKSDLQAALDKAPRPERPSGPPGSGRPGDRPDDGALAKSLAGSLNLDQTVVEAALDKVHGRHEANRQDHREEMAAALAKKLGLSTAKVEEAFQSLPRR